MNKSIAALLVSILLFSFGCSDTTSDPKASDRELEKAIELVQARDFAGAVVILNDITENQPDNARAWSLLGMSLHSMGFLDRALPAYLKATEFPDTAPDAMYNVACAYALKKDKEKAFEWLVKAQETGRVDMTKIEIDTNLEILKEDPRFKELLPKAEDFRDPFVEETRILQEWVGEAKGGAFGWIARNIGDVDGDGVNDVTTSAPNLEAGGVRSGRIYVYSGGTGELIWTQSGEPGNQLGLGIEAAGDVNADGVPDVIAGAPGAGESYVYSGKDGSLLLTLNAEVKGDMFGRKVSGIGDVNGDGHHDVIVGAPGNDLDGEDAGRAYVFSGKDGVLLLTLNGEGDGDNFGSSAAGLFDGDHEFIVVGAPNAGPENKGRAYVYSGASGEIDFVIDADETGSQLGGMFVSVVGDVNADGVADVYASDWSDNALGAQTGRIYVHSGANGERLLTLTGEEAGDGFGIGPADAGDVDEDGHDDLIVGAWQHSGAAPGGGKVYLHSGKDGSLMRAFTSKVQGDTLGFDATGMGDVDGDGKIDLLVTSAWSAIAGARSGRMFILSSETP